jgi:hypothetical protein
MTRKILPYIILVFTNFVLAQYQCSWQNFSAGGNFLTSTNYRAQITLGQTAIGRISSSVLFGSIGFWYPGITSGLEEPHKDPKEASQLVTQLNNAYPNPFRFQTTISFSLGVSGKVALYIYDITGRVVNTLINENLPAGRYSFSWNGTGYDGKKVASGLYFYRLQTNEYSKTRKLLFTRD